MKAAARKTLPAVTVCAFLFGAVCSLHQTVLPADHHQFAALAQLALSLALAAVCGWLEYTNAGLRTALAAQRALTGRTRTPQLTMVLPGLKPRAPDPLPRFRLTHLDGRVDPDGVARPPGLPFSSE